jgi:hypothetical protein
VGPAIIRYDNWSKGPAKRYQINPDYRPDYWVGVVAQAMCVAGKKVFVGIGATAEIQVFDRANGEYLGSLNPGPEVGGQSGWIDIPYGVNAYLRNNGEYIVVVEEDARCKNIVYRLTTNDAGPDWRAADALPPDSIEQAPGTEIDFGHAPATNHAAYSLTLSGNSVHINIAKPGLYTIEIVDPGGRLVSTYAGHIEHRIEIPFAPVSKGIYLAKAMSGSRTVSSGKILR